MKSNIQLKYSNNVAFNHFHGTTVNNSGLSYKFQDEDAFHDMMMDTINDIQKRNGCFYISSMVKECDISCSINNKNMVNITYTVLCEKENVKEVCLQLISNDIVMFTRSF